MDKKAGSDVVPEGMKEMQSVKRKVKHLVPEDQTYIYQPNRITLTKYKSTLVLERLLTLMQAALQEAVKQSMSGVNDYSQLSLFKENEIKIEIPFKMITRANTLRNKKKSSEGPVTDASEKQYVYELCNSLMDLKLHYPSVSEDGKTVYKSIRHFISGVDIPEKIHVTNGKERLYLKSVIIRFTPEQADRFVKMDFDDIKHRPINFTKFLLHTAVNAKNKYTPKLYKLICSWAQKGGFFINVDELKELLDIKGTGDDNKPYDHYPNYSDLVKRVLEPVRLELYRQTNCWFEYAPYKKDGKKVSVLRFKVVTPVLEKELSDQFEHAKNFLQTKFHFTPADIKSVQRIFSSEFDMEKFFNKMLDINEYLAKNRGKIGNEKAVVVRSLLNAFPANKDTE
jgi:hypothetical protein